MSYQLRPLELRKLNMIFEKMKDDFPPMAEPIAHIGYPQMLHFAPFFLSVTVPVKTSRILLFLSFGLFLI